MRALIQRVSRACVMVDGEVTGQIGAGLAVLIGVMDGDMEKEAELLAKKLTELRIFTDPDDKMNLSVADINGGILVISQFTLGADCSHGRRPSFIKAARPEIAFSLYEHFLKCVQERFAGPLGTGIFGAHMEFELCNDGPVTIWMDTEEWRNSKK